MWFLKLRLNYIFLNTNFALKLQGKYWKNDLVTFTAHLCLKTDTHKGFCPRIMLQDHFARVSTHEGALFAPGACSQVFNRLNIVEHFAGWKFCSRGWSIPMKSLVHTEELCSRSVPLKHAPGAKPLVCSGLNYQTFNKIQAKSSCARHVGGQQYDPQHDGQYKSY